MYFTLIGLPMVFFGAGMAVDFTTIIIAARQVSNAAQASALSGAMQYAPDSVSLNPADAKNAAVETWCRAQAAGQMSRSTRSGLAIPCANTPGLASITVTPISSGVDTAGNTVYSDLQVTARYRVDGLVFARLLGSSSGYVAKPIVRTATVCVPGQTDGPTGGYCAHPTD